MATIGELMVKIGADASGFTSGMKKVDQSLKVAKAEFDLATVKIGNFGSAADKLNVKAGYLSKQIGLQKEKVDALKTAYDKAVASGNADADALTKLQIKTLQAEKALVTMENELKQVNDELSKQPTLWNKITDSMKATGEKMVNIGREMSMKVTLPILAGAGAAVKFASDISESTNKVEVAFKNNAKQIEDWSNTTLKSIGLAKGTALDMAATYGDMATGMGLNTSQAAKMSASLVDLGGDLASFKNKSIDIVNTGLNGIFTGETESLKQLGIVMTQANLQEFALSKNIKKKVQDMSQAEQVQLRYNYVMAMTTNAHGDFVRTGGGAANQTRILKEGLKELAGDLGTKLLPSFTRIVTILNKAVETFSKLPGPVQTGVIAVLLLAAALGPLLTSAGMAMIVIPPLITAIKGFSIAATISKAVDLLALAFSRLSMAMVANPIGAIVTAIAVGILLIAFSSEAARAKISALINKLKELVGIKTAAAAESDATGITNIAKAMNTYSDSIDGVAASAKDAKKFLASFDEVYQMEDDTSGRSSSIPDMGAVAAAGGGNDKGSGGGSGVLNIPPVIPPIVIPHVGPISVVTPLFNPDPIPLLQPVLNKLQELKERLTGPWPVLQPFPVPNLAPVWDSAVNKLKELREWLSKPWPSLQPFPVPNMVPLVANVGVALLSIKMAWDAGLTHISNAWSQSLTSLQTALQPSLNVMQGFWENHKGLVLGIVAVLVAGIALAIFGIPASVTAVAATIGAGVAELAIGLAVKWNSIAEAATIAFERLGPAFRSAISNLPSIASGIASKVMAYFAPISKAISSFGSRVGSYITGSSVAVPAYASGTNYAAGGWSLVGEAGPELINLPRGSSVTPIGGPTGGGGSSISMIIDYDQLAAAMVSAMQSANITAKVDTSRNQMVALERALQPARTSETARRGS